MTERCIIQRCQTAVAATSLMCRVHWRYVPYELQKIILANEPLTRARMAAAQRAIDVVMQVERELSDERAARHNN